MSQDMQNSQLDIVNKEFGAQIKDITPIAKDTFQVRFSFEDGLLTHSPGQYVWVELPKLLYPDARGERRAFSITSPVSEIGSLSIQFRNSDSGYKRTLLSLQPGSKVKIIGPFGSSYIPSKDQKKVVLIAGGVGVAPFLSILRSLSQTDTNTQYTLVYLNSSPDTVVFYDELTALASSRNFLFNNHIGRLNESVFPASVDFANDTFFICGPSGMVDAVYKILTTKNVPLEHMHFEQHYPSTDGNLTEEDFKLKPNERNVMLQAVQDSRNHVIITDMHGMIIFANKRAQENTGFTFGEMRGNTPRLWGGLMPVGFYQNLWRKKHEAVGFDGELTNRRKNGQLYYVLAHISAIRNDQNVIVGYIGTEEDITAAKQIDKAKSEFVSLASHQLRTPLSSINWYAEMLESGDGGRVTPKQHEFLKEIYVASQRMVGLVNALLNVSRLELGRLTVDPSPTDLVALSKAIIAELKPLIEKNKLTISEQYKTSMPKAMVDPKLISIVIQNLLTNAVKYTKEKGTIDFSIEMKKAGESLGERSVAGDSFAISVKDTGIGIPTNFRDKIFTKLFRADNARDLDQDGTGLGLYLVKEIVDLAGGAVWYDSVEDKGSTFYVLLPVKGMTKSFGKTSLK